MRTNVPHHAQWIHKRSDYFIFMFLMSHDGLELNTIVMILFVQIYFLHVIDIWSNKIACMFTSECVCAIWLTVDWFLFSLLALCILKLALLSPDVDWTAANTLTVYSIFSNKFSIQFTSFYPSSHSQYVTAKYVNIHSFYTYFPNVRFKISTSLISYRFICVQLRIVIIINDERHSF